MPLGAGLFFLEVFTKYSDISGGVSSMRETWQKFWRVRANKICFLFLAALLLYVLCDAWPAETPPAVAPPTGQVAENKESVAPKTGRIRAVAGTAAAGPLQDPFRLELSGKKDHGEKQGNAPAVSNEKDRPGTHGRLSEEPRTPPPAEVAPELVLTGIMQSEEKRLALLRLAGKNFAVPVGGRIGSYEVILIGAGEAVLSGENGEIVLTMGKKMNRE